MRREHDGSPEDYGLIVQLRNLLQDREFRQLKSRKKVKVKYLYVTRKISDEPPRCTWRLPKAGHVKGDAYFMELQ